MRLVQLFRCGSAHAKILDEGMLLAHILVIVARQGQPNIMVVSVLGVLVVERREYRVRRASIHIYLHRLAYLAKDVVCV